MAQAPPQLPTKLCRRFGIAAEREVRLTKISRRVGAPIILVISAAG